MPVEHRLGGPRKHPQHDALVAELVRHLKNEANLPPEPRIVEEEQPLGGALHVFVYWREFESVREEERSTIIVEAYDKALGKEKMLKITVAMGVTPVEAKRLGMES